jgi:hypothetical protein
MKKVKSLFVLRWYANGLRFLAELVLIFYILLSIYSLFSSSNDKLLSILVSLQGIPVVIAALALIFISQIIELAIGLYDRVDIIKKKTLGQEFEEDSKAEISHYKRNSFTVKLILISIFMVLLNVTKIFVVKSASSNNDFENLVNADMKNENQSNEEYTVSASFNYKVSAGCLILVADYDFPNKMTYNEAVVACEKLGDDWRLPDQDEISEIYKQLHLKTQGNFYNNEYWTTLSRQSAQPVNVESFFSFVNGQSNYTEMEGISVSSKLNVRPVKTISCH